MMDIKYALLMAPGFVLGLSIHEAAHAITSYWLGDNLAGKQGRITLNPLKHLSPLGTLMLFIAGFGWGNPVQVNLYNYKHPKRDYLISSLAGPVSNMIVAAISIALMYGLNHLAPVIQGMGSWAATAYHWGGLFLFFSMVINVVLAVINLIPIPPLDGSKIWPCIIPGMRPTHSSKTMWMWVIVLVIMLKTGATGKIIDPIVSRVLTLMPAMVQLEQRPSDFPEDLYAPPQATEIEYETMDEEDQYYYLGFSILEEHPPVEFEKWLEEYLEMHEWQPQTDEQEGQWIGKKESASSWLYQRRDYRQPDNDTLQIQLYRYVEPENSEPSEWMYAYFYYDGNEEEQ